jgi:hypothetical protein
VVRHRRRSKTISRHVRPAGHLDALGYDDDEDGTPDRSIARAITRPIASRTWYLLLDSIPFRCVADRYAAGELRWFDRRPRK